MTDTEERIKMLFALNKIFGDRIYAGTVTEKTKQQRRRKNKMQKASRKANR